MTETKSSTDLIWIVQSQEGKMKIFLFEEGLSKRLRYQQNIKGYAWNLNCFFKFRISQSIWLNSLITKVSG